MHDGDDVQLGPFDQVAEWKAQAAIDLGLAGEQLVAALSPGPAFPTVLRNMIAAMSNITADTVVVDLGAGVGSISTWVATQTAAQVIAVEPSPGSRRAGRRLFPELDLRSGTAARSGLPNATADVVLLTGVISLLADLEPVCTEARRLLRRGGVVGIADMFLNADERSAGRVSEGVNTLRSAATAGAELAEHGLATISAGCASCARPAVTWARAAERLNERVQTDHRNDGRLTTWLTDQTTLAGWIDSGRVHGAYLLCAPTR